MRLLLHPDLPSSLPASAVLSSDLHMLSRLSRWLPCCQALPYRLLRSCHQLPLQQQDPRMRLSLHPDLPSSLPASAVLPSDLHMLSRLPRWLPCCQALLYRLLRSCHRLPLQHPDRPSRQQVPRMRLLPHPEHPCCLPAASDLRSEHCRQLRRLRWLPCCQSLLHRFPQSCFLLQLRL